MNSGEPAPSPLRRLRAAAAARPKAALYAACTAVGLGGGIAAIALKESVHEVESVLRGAVASRDLNPLILALPAVGLLLTALLVRRFVRSDLSHGVSQVLRAISRRGGDVPRRMIWAPLAACTITVGFGGSLGMEAPIMHSGSAIGSAAARALGFDYRRRVLMLGCGTAAAVAAIFKAPVAGAIFAVEILMIDLTAQAAIPLLVSSVTGALFSKIVAGRELEFHFAVFQPFDHRNIPAYLALGAICGLGAAYLRAALGTAASLFGRITRPYARAAAGALALAPLLLVFPSLFGEGYTGMVALLTGGAGDLLSSSPFYGADSGGWGFVAYLAALFLAKGAAAAITGAAGGVGGVFAPSLFMGSVAGCALARALRLLGVGYASELNFALVGMAGVLAALLKAPLTSVFLIAEITGGYALLVPLILTAGVAVLVARRFSRFSIYAEGLAERRELVTHDKSAAAMTLLDPGSLVEADYPSFRPEATVEELARAVPLTRRGCAAVVDERGVLLGVLAFSDLRPALMALDESRGLCVSDLASAPPAVLGPGTGMEAALESFERSGAQDLPFVGADGRFLGFVSRAAALAAYREKVAELSAEEG